METKAVSVVYDNQNQYVTHLQKESVSQVRYEELPDVFIDALLSEEDVRFLFIMALIFLAYYRLFIKMSPLILMRKALLL